MKKPQKKLIITVVAIIAAVSVATTSLALTAPIIQRMLAGTDERTITVDMNTVINEDYLGVGANQWSGSRTEMEAERLGTNPAYLELTYKRAATVQAALVRMMVLPSDIVDKSDGAAGEINWKNGVYDFTNDNIMSFLTWVEAFDRCGTEVMLNWGGRITDDIVNWFAIEDSTWDESGTRSAPADLDAFARAGVALIKYCYDKGWDNITHVSFYNETNGTNFQAFGDRRVYMGNMVAYFDKYLRETTLSDGSKLRDHITIVGQDSMQDGGSAQVEPFFGYFSDLADKSIAENGYSTFEALSIHAYGGSNELLKDNNAHYDYLKKLYDNFNKTPAGNKLKLYLGEYNASAAYYKDMHQGDVRFFNSATGQVLNTANIGYSTGFLWCLCGGVIKLNNFVTQNMQASALWLAPSAKNSQATGDNQKFISGPSVDHVTAAFGETGLLMRYIPKHSRVYKSTVSNRDNTYSAVFENGDDMTVVIEVDEANADTAINVDFGKNLGKTFGKYVYEIPKNNEAMYLFDANAILPTKISEMTVSGSTLNDTIGNHAGINYPDLNSDKIDVTYTISKDDPNTTVEDVTPTDYKGNSGHYLIIYTTLPEAKQIALKDVQVFIEPDESVQLELDKVYGSDCNEVTWSIIKDQNENITGTITADGLYTATGAQRGDTIAIKAELNDGSGTYAVAIVQINE